MTSRVKEYRLFQSWSRTPSSNMLFLESLCGLAASLAWLSRELGSWRKGHCCRTAVFLVLIIRLRSCTTSARKYPPRVVLISMHHYIRWCYYIESPEKYFNWPKILLYNNTRIRGKVQYTLHDFNRKTSCIYKSSPSNSCGS